MNPSIIRGLTHYPQGKLDKCSKYIYNLIKWHFEGSSEIYDPLMLSLCQNHPTNQTKQLNTV